MVSDGALPDLPRRISPRDFALDFYPRLVAALQPAARSLPMRASLEIEVEGDGGGVFTVAVDTAGQVTVAEGEGAHQPWAAVVLSRAAYDALLAIFSRWHRRRAKQGDQAALTSWIEQRYTLYRQRMPDAARVVAEHPAVVELHVTDDVGDVHVITLEIGAPGDTDPFLRIRLSLEDIPLDAHAQSSAALESLARAKVRLEGDADYLTHLTDLLK